VRAGRINRQGDSRNGDTAEIPLVSPQEAHSVVTIWSALGSTDAEPSIVDESNAFTSEAVDATGDEIPDWMLAAFAGVDGDELLDSEHAPGPAPAPNEDDEETL